MIVKQDEPNISCGMLIDWDLCKSTGPLGETSAARHITRTVSRVFEVPISLALICVAFREHGSLWQQIWSINPPFPKTLSMT